MKMDSSKGLLQGGPLGAYPIIAHLSTSPPRILLCSTTPQDEFNRLLLSLSKREGLALIALDEWF